jgi:hypothetical protein
VSTATQNALDAHETAERGPVGSTETGLDQPTLAADAVETPAMSVASVVGRRLLRNLTDC